MDAAYLNFDGVDLYFPAVLSEGGERTATVTEHAVELGANIVDHVRQNSAKVSLEVHLSETPIEIGGLADMQYTFVELDVPKANKPLIPTPGALIQATATAVQGLINGTPVYKALVLKASNKVSIVKDVIQLLEGWQRDAVLGTVILPWATIESCIISAVNPKRSPDDGDAVRVSLEFTQINLVETRLVTAPTPTEVRAKPKVAKGKQPTTPMKEADASIWYAALNKKGAIKPR